MKIAVVWAMSSHGEDHTPEVRKGAAATNEAEATAVLGLRIAAMRALLQSLGPTSDRDALALLREAFPDLPLAERIEAFGRWRR